MPVPFGNRATNAIPKESPIDADLEVDTSLDSSADDSMTTASTDPTAQMNPATTLTSPLPQITLNLTYSLTPVAQGSAIYPARFLPASTTPLTSLPTIKLLRVSEASAPCPLPHLRDANALNLLQQEGMSPLRQTPTGTRYGAALGPGNTMSLGVHMTGTGRSPRKWGGTTPVCSKCSKNVYFAEQVEAVGKTYHKLCLRCTECTTTLDSTKLRDHDGEAFCVRCYNKLHGPQGHGYALLGKAGG